MSCGSSTLKVTLLLLNSLCCIFGVLTLLACSYALVEYYNFYGIQIPCTLALILSSILFLNTILGFRGIARKSIIRLRIYTVIMLLLMLGQIAVIFFEPIKIREIFHHVVSYHWDVKHGGDFEMTMYEMQYQCCGKDGPYDYKDAGLLIPLSCYLNNNNSTIKNLYFDGCIKKITESYEIYQTIEDISDWVQAGLEGAAGLVAVMMATSLKHIKRRNQYH